MIAELRPWILNAKRKGSEVPQKIKIEFVDTEPLVVHPLGFSKVIAVEN